MVDFREPDAIAMQPAPIIGEGAKAADRPRLVLCLLVAVFAINFLDRQIVSLFAQPIKVEFGLNDTEVGLLYGFGFALLYGVIGIPIARYADHGNRGLVIKISVAFFSVMSALCGLASSYPQLLAARAGVAIGESGTNPPSHSMVADLFPPRLRSAAMSFFSLGPHIGFLLGYFGAGWIGHFWGWRTAFVSAGLAGLVVTAVCSLLLREPARNKSAGSAPIATTYRAIASVLGSASSRHIFIGSTVFSAATYAIMGWLPSLLIREGMGVGAMGTLLALTLGLGGGFGTFGGGLLTERLAGGDPRRRLQILSLVLCMLALAWLAVFLATDLVTRACLMVVPAAFIGFYLGPTFATMQSVVDPRARALVAAMLVFTGNVIGLGLGPLVIGIMSDALSPYFEIQSLRLSLTLATPLCLWAAAHYWAASLSINDDIRRVEKLEPAS